VLLFSDDSVTRPGYCVGLATLDEELSIESLPVEGEIPAWLTGALIRNGPARFEVGGRSLRHWFDGLAMLHRFSFGEGRVAYANRFLRGLAHREAARGRTPYRGFGTDPRSSVLHRLAPMLRPLTDNCNVNLTRLGDDYLALSEAPLPLVFDPETLETLGRARRAPGLHVTSHPHRDRRTGELVFFATHLGPRCEYRIYSLDGSSRRRRIASLRVEEPSYIHSFALTERYVVLVAFPLVVDPLRFALGRRPFIENYRWRPRRGTRLLVVDRERGELVSEHQAAPRFAFHHVNAFERDGELVVDTVAYEDASIIDALYLDRLRAAPPPVHGRLLRYRVPIDTAGEVIEERLSDTPLEFPRIDYEARNGRPYRFVYGAGTDDDGGPPDFLDQVVKVDVETGETRVWFEPGSYPGEPVFVPAPRSGRAEDEGVLLSLVLDTRGPGSYLLVLDASTLAELGRARLPRHVPFGFHGQYFA